MEKLYKIREAFDARCEEARASLMRAREKRKGAQVSSLEGLDLAREDFAFSKFQEGGEAYDEAMEIVAAELSDEDGEWSYDDDSEGGGGSRGDYDDKESDGGDGEKGGGGGGSGARAERRRATREARLAEARAKMAEKQR